VVREDHTEKDSVGSKIESGSILIAGGAAFVVSAGHGGMPGSCSGLDQALDAVSEIVSGDLFGVDADSTPCSMPAARCSRGVRSPRCKMSTTG
jgi:hypothetical protein